MSLRDHFLKDLGWKILSLTLATLIWFAIRSGMSTEFKPVMSLVNPPKIRLFSQVPITVMTAAADTRGFKVTPRTVNLMVSGDAAVLENMESTDVEVFVNLTAIQDATDLRIKPKYHAPIGVTVLRVTPADVEIQRVSTSK